MNEPPSDQPGQAPEPPDGAGPLPPTPPPPPVPGPLPSAPPPPFPGTGTTGGEGVPTGPTDPQGRPLAHWWKRVVAFVIDAIIVYAISLIVGFVVGGGAEVAAVVIGLVIHFTYFTLLNGSARGQTVGKMVIHIAVRDVDSGGPIGYFRAFARALAEYVFLVLFVLPWILDVLWPLWDPQRQAWHDKAVRSLMVVVD